MKNDTQKHFVISLGAIVVSTAMSISTLQANPLTWDATGGALPLEDGSGNWDPTGGSNWYDADAGTWGAWGNTTSTNAIIGVGNGAAGTIAVGTVNAGGITFNAAGSGNYTLSGGSISLAGGSQITVNSSASISSVLSGAHLQQVGTGTLTLSGANSNSGSYTVAEGTLDFAGGNRFGNGVQIILGSVGKTATFTGMVTSSRSLLVADGGVGVFNHVSGTTSIGVVGASTGTFRKTGNGTVEMTSIASQNVELQGGTFDARGSGFTGALTIDSGAVLAVNRANNTVEVGSLSGSGSVRGNSLSGASTLAVGGLNTSTTFSGSLQVNATRILDLDKVGTGTLTLTGNNTFTGATTVTDGTLRVAGTGAMNSTSNIAVNGGTFAYDSSTALNRDVTLNGGTFSHNSGSNYTGTLTFDAGGGTVGGSNLSNVDFASAQGRAISSGRILSPGNSTGTLTVASAEFAEGGTFVLELNNATGTAGSTSEGWDLLDVTGALSITATTGTPFVIELVSLDSLQQAGLAQNFDPESSYNWLFAEAGSSITGFTPSSFTITTAGFQNTYDGTFSVLLGDTVTDGNDSQLYLNYAPIPEPSYGFMLLSVVLVVFCARGRGRARRAN